MTNRLPAPQVCPSCHLELPATGNCDCHGRQPLTLTLAQAKPRILARRRQGQRVDPGGRRYSSRPWTSWTSGRPPTPQFCDHPTDGAFVCPACLDQWDTFAADAPALLEDLDQARIKDVRFIQHGTTASSEDGASVPFAEKAAQLRRELLAALAAIKDPWETARSRQGAPQAFWHAEQLMVRAWHLIDRPRDLVYLGACDCGTELWADRGATILRCPGCKLDHYYDELVAALVAQADEAMLTAEEIITAVPTLTRTRLQRHIAAGRIRTEQRRCPRWVDGQIIASTTTVHRLGDALDAAALDQRLAAGITIDAVARELGIQPATVRKLVERNHLCPIQPGARPLRFDPDEIDRYWEIHTPSPHDDTPPGWVARQSETCHDRER